MTRIADRSPVLWTAAIAGALTCALAVWMWPTHEQPRRHKRAPIDRKCVEYSHRADTCPTWARERLRLPADATVRCAKGNFGEPGWFVHGVYTTTERWERYGVLTPDGTREIVSLVDRPSLFDAVSYSAVDVDGDGKNEVLGRYAGATELMRVRGDVITTRLVRDNQP
jgi:hypothetical protein